MIIEFQKVLTVLKKSNRSRKKWER